MAWYNPSSWNKRTKVQGYAEQDNTGQWLQYFNQYFSSNSIEKFTRENAYQIAGGLAEVFIPIDAIAEREASVRYGLKNIKTGEEYIPTGNLERLISKPNPFDRWADLVYKASFSELADGNSYVYTKLPDSIKNPTIDNISNIWVLSPDVTKPKIKKEVPNPFLIKDKAELIDYYATFFMFKQDIQPRYILHRTALGINQHCIANSPLQRAEKNINNLLATYEARYNVYAKNGNGGILSRAASGGANSSLQEAIDPPTRDMMLKDLQDRNGITGNKNFVGISSIPLTFIKTLGTISELEPFKETEADLITIGGLFGVDKYLLPISEGTTFTNKQDAEKNLWQNVIKGRCEDRAKDMNKWVNIPDGITFYPDFSTVEALQEDKKTGLEADSVMLDNMAKLTLAGQDVKQGYANLTEKYNGQG
jgi:hypothetical protein